MENLNIIPVFVAVVDCGSFSAAADKLALSKSAVSKRISALEGQLATRLLHRSTRALSLTHAGERYYEHAVKALSAAREANDAVSQLQGEPAGPLRICAPMALGRLHLAPIIHLFLQRYPKLTIDLVLSDSAINIVEQGFDIAIGSGDLPSEGLIVRKLTSALSTICASHHYVTQQPPINTPEDLLQHNCLTYSLSSNAQTWRFERNKITQTIKVEGNYQVNNSEVLAQAVVAGLGVARLPSFIAAQMIAAQQLVPLLTEYQMPQKQIYVSYAQRKFLPHKVRVFLDFCIEQLAADTAHWDIKC